MKRRNKFVAMLFLGMALVLGGCGQSAVAGAARDNSEVIEEVIEEVREEAEKADLSDATYITLESGQDVMISSEGVYVIQGTATDTSIIVEADAAKVQIVLDGVTITNSDAPAIYVKSADTVLVTTTDSENTLTVTGSFTADGDTNTDAVIFSKDDLEFSGEGTLIISSTANGISGKDDIKFTGGTYNITAAKDGIEANDYIKVDGGTFDIDASEGLEATYVQINDGTLSINASDDGINASSKNEELDVVIEINGGSLTINMASGDTDALDANGDLYINGGTVDITAQFAFDFDGKAELNGGTVTVNGEEVTEITNSMTFGGGGGQRGFGGGNPPEMPEGFDGSNPPEMPEGFEEGDRPEIPADYDKGSRPEMPQNGMEKKQNGGN